MAKTIAAAAILLISADFARADVIAYECNSLPPDFGWQTINEFCDAEQWIDNGWLVQRVVPCEEVPGAGQQFDYKYPLGAFEGVPTFFLEWHIFADGDQSEIPFGAPALISLGSQGPVVYHWVMARDRIRFVRNNPIEDLLFFDFDPTTSHTFRIEQIGETTYFFYMDGVAMATGVPGAPFPVFNPTLNIRAKSHLLDNTVNWDYIRWGQIPIQGSLDFNSDGQIDEFEVPFFVECLLGPDVDAGPGCRWADSDSDADVDLFDCNAFLNAWTGVADPSAPIDCSGGASIPAISQWGIVVCLLSLGIAGSIVFCRVPHRFSGGGRITVAYTPIAPNR